MKKVFSSHSEVCHVWASQSQSEGIAGNVSFIDNTIFSYHWWSMAKFINPDTVLIRNWSYSNSTSKHMNYVNRSLASHINKIYCNDPGKHEFTPHNDNISKMILKLKENTDSFARSRNYKESILRSQYSQLSNLQEYCNLFNLPMPDVSNVLLNEETAKIEIERQNIRLKELKQTKELRRQKLIESKQKEIIKLENDWINGLTDKTSISLGRHYYDLEFSMIRLRIKNDTVQTSLGADVPIREAKILYERIKQGKDIKGFKIGFYTVIGMNGTLKIGCHNIEKIEMERFASLMSW